ncbi:hypothetical protein IFM89_035896 [Coptis chinensis]|uniref:Uncharacterized protein n=1 Tax=Coptis chinensis TaxID=261450 RepID=A0A835H4M2_9MAGN|nr:hypothetical protein IFM89_035896 [Coptis chinensis]
MGFWLNIKVCDPVHSIVVCCACLTLSKLGLAGDIALASRKALLGYLSGSIAIILVQFIRVVDVVLSGNGKFDTLGALGISSMLFVTAGGIAWHAMDILLGLLASTPGMDSHGHSGGHGDYITGLRWITPSWL